MPQLNALAAWQNFYVISGTSAGSLTGLQFVVIALLAQTRAAGDGRDLRAFGTPTVTHFCTALLISILATAPWPSLASLGICLGIFGAIGVLYSFSIVWHARKAAYRPDLEDWVWYTGVPCLAHLLLLGSAVALWWGSPRPLIVIAGDTLLLLFLGVRNAWDTVTFIALRHGRGLARSDQSE